MRGEGGGGIVQVNQSIVVCWLSGSFAVRCILCCCYTLFHCCQLSSLQPTTNTSLSAKLHLIFYQHLLSFGLLSCSLSTISPKKLGFATTPYTTSVSLFFPHLPSLPLPSPSDLRDRLVAVSAAVITSPHHIISLSSPSPSSTTYHTPQIIYTTRCTYHSYPLCTPL